MKTDWTDKKQRMLELIQHAHAKQSRNNGRVPYWMHPQSVAEIVEQALLQSDEVEPDSSTALDLYLAAQGHDLYEDTEVSSQQIIDLFGERVHSWIEYLTNRHGDQNRTDYLKHIQAAPEEVRLIKLGDLIDNSASCAYGLHDLGAEWVIGFLLPVVNEMREIIGRTAFANYPQTARRLSAILEFSCTRLRQNTLKFLSPSPTIAPGEKGCAMSDKPEDKPARTNSTKAKPLKKVYVPLPPEQEIDAESWKRALERTRAKERAEGATFPGGKPFLIPSSDDYDKGSDNGPDEE